MNILYIFFTMFLSMTGFSAGESLLTHEARVNGFGSIKYRPPLVESNETPVVLFHGIYGGASHRTWRHLVPELDAAGRAVFLMDLPGVGESDKPKRSYDIEDFDAFVEGFLVEVVGTSANLISESILSNGVLRVAADRPDLVHRVAILNPSGIGSLRNPPSQRQQSLYDRYYNNDAEAKVFYRNLLRDNSLRYFLAFGFYDDSLIDDGLLADFRILQGNLDQRFISLSFIGGQLFRSFEESSKNVFTPVIAIFGAEYEAFQNNPITRASDFSAVRPEFNYVEIQGSGSAVQRERPLELSVKLLDFFADD